LRVERPRLCGRQGTKGGLGLEKERVSEMQVRYDETREVYRDCKWCGGNGCLCCKAEADKEYARQFPRGPQPIATFERTPEGIERARRAIGGEALARALGPGGGGIAEIIRNCKAAEAEGGKVE